MSDNEFAESLCQIMSSRSHYLILTLRSHYIISDNEFVILLCFFKASLKLKSKHCIVEV